MFHGTVFSKTLQSLVFPKVHHYSSELSHLNEVGWEGNDHDWHLAAKPAPPNLLEDPDRTYHLLPAFNTSEVDFPAVSEKNS